MDRPLHLSTQYSNFSHVSAILMSLIKSYLSSLLPFLNELLLYRVKLAIDLKTKKQVAVKILKVKEGKATEFSKY